jgi:hypothetical protein
VLPAVTGECSKGGGTAHFTIPHLLYLLLLPYVMQCNTTWKVNRVIDRGVTEMTRLRGL